VKRILGTAVGALALAGSTLIASPAEAAGPVFTGGLVNVTIVDVIDDITISDVNVSVGAAVAAALNVCDVNVGGILGQLRDDGSATCTSETGDTLVTIENL